MHLTSIKMFEFLLKVLVCIKLLFLCVLISHRRFQRIIVKKYTLINGRTFYFISETGQYKHQVAIVFIWFYV